MLVGCTDISALIQVTPAVRHDSTATVHILKRQAPHLLVQHSTKFGLVINLQASRTIGLEVPPTLAPSPTK
jgi:hypothetical protein